MTTVIVGGGLAGLAAAVQLTQGGTPVTLLESRSFCGGRAYSYPAPVVGDTVDNGQHVMLGCYQATLDFLSRIGTRPFLELQSTLSLPFLAQSDSPFWFRCPRLPAPLHLLTGVARFCGVKDAWALVKHRSDLMADPLTRYVEWDQWSCAEWFAKVGLSKKGVHRLWEPLVLAVMNDAPARVSVAPFLVALHRIATGPASAASLALSRVGLSDLFVAPAVTFLEEQGSVVRSGVGVVAVKVRDNRVVAVTTTTGEEIPVSRLIVATPPRALAKILETVPDTIVLREMLNCWQESPILSVYFWYDRPVMDHPMVGILNSPFHWAFCRNALLSSSPLVGEGGVRGKSTAFGVTLVVSGASDFDKMSRDDVTELALTAMQQFFPKSHDAQLIHRMVSREPHATVRLAPGTQRLRTAIRSPWPNVEFIGDWTDTHLPATIEGAITSGLSVQHLT